MAGNLRGQITSSLDAYLKNALKPLKQAMNMFKPGGSYGAGQYALIDEQAKQAQAQALANQVASGMSSGSLATSTGLRVGRDMTTAKLGVEDQRTQYLNQILQALSSMYGQFGDMALRQQIANKQNSGQVVGGNTVSFGGGGDPANSFFSSGPARPANPYGLTDSQWAAAQTPGGWAAEHNQLRL